MYPSQRKQRTLNETAKNPMSIKGIWETGAEPHQIDPPPQNIVGNIPFASLIYNIRNLNDIHQAIVVDNEFIDLIRRKSPIFDENKRSRELIMLTLMGFKDVFTVYIWVIPLYMDGVISAQIFATDDVNQQRIKEHRSPTKPGDYDFSV